MGCATSLPVGDTHAEGAPPTKQAAVVPNSNPVARSVGPSFHSAAGSVKQDELRAQLYALQQQLTTELVAKSEALTTSCQIERQLRESELARQALATQLVTTQQQIVRLTPPVVVLYDIENKPLNDIVQLECFLTYIERLLVYAAQTARRRGTTPTAESAKNASPMDTSTTTVAVDPSASSPSASLPPGAPPATPNSRSLIPLVPPPQPLTSTPIEVQFHIFGCVNTCGIVPRVQEYIAKRNIPWQHVLHTSKDVADHALFTRLREVTRRLGDIGLPIPICIISADQDFCSRIKHEIDTNGIRKEDVFIVGDDFGRPPPLATFPNYLSFNEIVAVATHFFKDEVDIRTNPVPVGTLPLTPSRPIGIRLKPTLKPKGTPKTAAVNNTVTSPTSATSPGTSPAQLSPTSKAPRVYSCCGCRQVFALKEDLITHVLAVHPTLGCAECRSIFRHQRNTTRHMRQMHFNPADVALPIETSDETLFLAASESNTEQSTATVTNAPLSDAPSQMQVALTLASTIIDAEPTIVVTVAAAETTEDEATDGDVDTSVDEAAPPLDTRASPSVESKNITHASLCGSSPIDCKPPHAYPLPDSPRASFVAVDACT